MTHKANQKKKASGKQVPKPTKELKTAVESGVEERAEEEIPFPTSLNQDLEELLKKNPRRFFGGCGG